MVRCRFGCSIKCVKVNERSILISFFMSNNMIQKSNYDSKSKNKICMEDIKIVNGWYRRERAPFPTFFGPRHGN